jgi:FixJ family two-component response regulator
LALVDIDLGDGGSGVDFARSLQERYGVPSIFVTGDPELASQASSVGIGYLAKPYRRTSIIEAVDVAQAIIEGRKPGKIPPDLTLFDDSQARWNQQLH